MSLTSPSAAPPELFDLPSARFKSQLRLKAAFENIFERYGKDLEDESDVIDLETGEVIVDNGFMRKSDVKVFGKTWAGLEKGMCDDELLEPLHALPDGEALGRKKRSSNTCFVDEDGELNLLKRKPRQFKVSDNGDDDADAKQRPTPSTAVFKPPILTITLDDSDDEADPFENLLSTPASNQWSSVSNSVKKEKIRVKLENEDNDPYNKNKDRAHFTPISRRPTLDTINEDSAWDDALPFSDDNAQANTPPAQIIQKPTHHEEKENHPTKSHAHSQALKSRFHPYLRPFQSERISRVQRPSPLNPVRSKSRFFSKTPRASKEERATLWKNEIERRIRIKTGLEIDEPVDSTDTDTETESEAEFDEEEYESGNEEMDEQDQVQPENNSDAESCSDEDDDSEPNTPSKSNFRTPLKAMREDDSVTDEHENNQQQVVHNGPVNVMSGAESDEEEHVQEPETSKTQAQETNHVYRTPMANSPRIISPSPTVSAQPQITSPTPQHLIPASSAMMLPFSSSPSGRGYDYVMPAAVVEPDEENQSHAQARFYPNQMPWMFPPAPLSYQFLQQQQLLLQRQFELQMQMQYQMFMNQQQQMNAHFAQGASMMRPPQMQTQSPRTHGNAFPGERPQSVGRDGACPGPGICTKAFCMSCAFAHNGRS